MPAGRLSVFPAFHRVSGRTVLVAGSGAEAIAKVRLLLQTEAVLRVVAFLPSEELRELASRHGLELRARRFQDADLDGAVLVFAASGDRNVDAEVVTAARARNIPANAVDQPDLCDFLTPAIVNRAPVAIAITSTGAGPVLAQKLRARIEAMLPMNLGALAMLGNSFRSAAERVLPKGQPRRRFWSAFFEGQVADAAFAGRSNDARRLAFRLLAESDAVAHGSAALVGTGPGAADLLTLRAHRHLQEADVIIQSEGVPDEILALARRDASLVQVAAPRQPDIGGLLVREAAAGRRVVLLVTGDPLEHCQAEIAALNAAQIPSDVVPGIATAERSETADMRAA